MKLGLKKATVATLMISALALSACGGSSESAQDSTSSSATGGLEVHPDGSINPVSRDELQDGGELRLAIPELSEQGNAFHANGTVYSTTLWRWYNPEIGLFEGDGTFYPNPAYIDDVKDETIDGKTVVTFTINEKATYNDGTPIDWRAFENTWKFNNGENPDLAVNSTDGYELIESVEPGENDKQAVITFKQVYVWWEGLFNLLLPPQVNSVELFNSGYLEQAHPEWGAGPFKLESIDYNTGTATFVRNEKWWGNEAKLDRVSYRQMEAQASLNAFKAGEIDITGVGDKERFAAAKSMGDKVDLRASRTAARYLIVLNSKTPKLADVNVRKALFTGIDRSQLAAIRFNGLEYTEDLPGSFLLYEGQEGYEDNLGQVLKYDPEAANKILDEAGWEKGSDGIREKDGEKLTIRYTLFGDDQMSKATASATQKMMKDIGVDLQIQERPTSDFSNVMTNRDFDFLPMGFRSGDPFGVAYFKQVYGSDSELNRSGTGTPELDAKIDELQQIADPDEQIKKANELEREALQRYGIMVFANGPTIIATPPKLANIGAAFFGFNEREDIGWMK